MYLTKRDSRRPVRCLAGRDLHVSPDNLVFTSSGPVGPTFK